MSMHFRIYNKDGQQRTSSNTLRMPSTDPLLLIKLLAQQNNAFCGIKGVRDNSNRLVPRIIVSKTAKFVAHFLLVIGLLYLSALVFLHLEEKCERKQPEIMNPQNASSIGEFLRSNNPDLTECDIEDIAMFFDEARWKDNMLAVNGGTSSNGVQKWFYFAVIATTTIGYGNIHPKTQNGKIFYCCFSVVGIILMMSLLRSCGGILTSINKRFNRFVRMYLCLEMDYWSEELLSFVSMVFLFIFYLSLGIWHDILEKGDSHSIVDIIYFWLVTFTTVGFGDIGPSLEFEIEHAYELTVYRIFGLSLVAAVIESLQSYLVLRKNTLQIEASERQKIIIAKLHSSMLSYRLDWRRKLHDGDDYNAYNAIREVASNSFCEFE